MVFSNTKIIYCFIFQDNKSTTERSTEADQPVDLKPPKGPCKIICYILTFPILVLFYCTVPDTRHPKRKL